MDVMIRLRAKPITLVVAGVIVLLAAAVAVLGYKYVQTSNSQKHSNQAVSSRVIQEVGDVYILPTNEEPSVILIQDKSKLSDQDFFRNAQNGDYLLVYKTNKLAMIYRESIRKLVTVGPVNLAGSSSSAGQKP